MADNSPYDPPFACIGLKYLNLLVKLGLGFGGVVGRREEGGERERSMAGGFNGGLSWAVCGSLNGGVCVIRFWVWVFRTIGAPG